MRPGPHVDALRDLVAQLMAIDVVNRYFGAMLGGLDLKYPMPGDHPRIGRPWGDLALTLFDGTAASTSALMQDGRALLLDLGAGDAIASPAADLTDRVQVVRASAARADLGALLIRPDGFVAWAAAPGAVDRDGLDRALRTWFGCGLA
jgi:anhydrotetracycline monooxygenase